MLFGLVLVCFCLCLRCVGFLCLFCVLCLCSFVVFFLQLFPALF